MASTEMVVDKEKLEFQKPKKEDEVEEAEDPAEEKRNLRQAAFLLSVYWIAWAVGATADVLLMIIEQTNSFQALTPLSAWIYKNRIDLAIYKQIDPYVYVSPKILVSTGGTGLATCALMQFALMGKVRASDLSLALTYVWMGLFMLGADWLGATGREAVVLALPLSWLSMTTILLALQSVKYDLSYSSIGLDFAPWTVAVIRYLSTAFFLLANWYTFETGGGFIVSLVLWESIRFVYAKL
ncbi:hypothetical protein BU24DRAFT_447388 [Aaosphaeria arxii CBS 175.79]|uniref:Uncharacterized protein n=1 Tax=Aaosphaeria arxii CBS 175.79 TaxID=1450172 RepID=A0A6A5XZW2_9PLEO|nr:uncharacterized protein BU24DRAFT_447388 [Aaosphaeria arxii CBS 175.79]KAF2018752.1 hypothetical protein BU24DRAFT_447388 [Aaosphaeria arxii CBS 175.79]